MNEDLKRALLNSQRNEITEHFIYQKLASLAKNEDNKKVLQRIADEELGHYDFLKRITNKEVSSNKWKILLYTTIAKILGLTFSLKLMERGEDLAQDAYEKIKGEIPEFENIFRDENRHEREIINLLDEERLKYISSMVLGLNDALVELTGALAGLTLALQNTRLVAIVGLITGIAASMSMSASEYLSTKQEDTEKSPGKASIYTGLAYILTVLFLIFPYVIFKNIFICLGFVLLNALIVILLFTFYISIAKDLSFKKRFLEMAGLSLSIAVVNFFIGMLIRKAFGVDV
jgi:VIT1/CCC1 family predicted Fe2+/Mn2+ transporter